MAMSLLQGGQNPIILNKSTYKFISSSTVLTPKDYEVEPKFYNEQTVVLYQQFRIQTFFGHTVFLKLRVRQFSDTPNPLMVVAEGPKIFDV